MSRFLLWHTGKRQETVFLSITFSASFFQIKVTIYEICIKFHKNFGWTYEARFGILGKKLVIKKRNKIRMQEWGFHNEEREPQCSKGSVSDYSVRSQYAGDDFPVCLVRIFFRQEAWNRFLFDTVFDFRDIGGLSERLQDDQDVLRKG